MLCYSNSLCYPIITVYFSLVGAAITVYMGLLLLYVSNYRIWLWTVVFIRVYFEVFPYCYYCQGMEDVNRPPQTWDPHPRLSTALQLRPRNLVPAWALSNKFLFPALSLILPLYRPQVYTTEQAYGKGDSTIGSLCLDLSPGYALDLFHSLAILGAADRCCYQHLI